MKMPRPDFSRIWSRFRSRGRSDTLLPFELVKYFAFTSLLLILIASFILSWMIADNAKTVLLQRSEAYSRLFADNLNRQVFLQFVLPTAVRYGRIALSDQVQFERLDQIVRNITRGMRIDSVTIFEPRQNRVAYSTTAELMGKWDMGGLEYQKAGKGENNSVLITGGSLFSLLPGTSSEVFCTLKTYVPFRQENKLGEQTGEIMGVIEIVQDLSDDLRAIIQLQGRVIILSLFILSILFTILSLIVIRANRIIALKAEERLRLEEQLNEAQRLASLGKMVAAVSHEIKNPLGIVRSTAEILGNRISKVAPGNEHLANIIVEETSRLDAIVREFLDFARPREAKMAPRSLNAVIERVLRFMEPEFKQKSVVVHVMLGDLPEIFMDSEQIYQVVFNIVFNATQAMPYGGDVTVQTQVNLEQGTVALEVTDTGIGIAPEKIEQIFTPFFTDKNRGTGLGLTIAKNIVEQHQGVIDVTSRPDEGSTFRVTLPVNAGTPTV
jgi:signal transduction histidine kinase